MQDSQYCYNIIGSLFAGVKIFIEYYKKKYKICNQGNTYQQYGKIIALKYNHEYLCNIEERLAHCLCEKLAHNIGIILFHNIVCILHYDLTILFVKTWLTILG